MSEMLKELRFYKEEFSDNTFTLFRWAETNTNLLLERWDTGANAWIHTPYFIEVTGIGGSVDYTQITEDEAVFLIASTKISPRDAVRLLTMGL